MVKWKLITLKSSVADPDPVGSGLFGVTRIRILKTGFADPEKNGPDPQHCLKVIKMKLSMAL